MRYIELRRHSIRIRPSSHITQEGVNKAQVTGKEMGEFVKVYSSKAPRAMETAVAMGYAIDDVFEEISMTPDGLEKEVSWGMSFDQYANIINKGGITSKYAIKMAKFLLELSYDIPEDSSILIVSHGGLIEIASIGCLPNLDYSDWGEPLDTCEGVRLTIDKNRFTNSEIKRVKW